MNTTDPNPEAVVVLDEVPDPAPAQRSKVGTLLAMAASLGALDNLDDATLLAEPGAPKQLLAGAPGTPEHQAFAALPYHAQVAHWRRKFRLPLADAAEQSYVAQQDAKRHQKAAKLFAQAQRSK